MKNIVRWLFRSNRRALATLAVFVVVFVLLGEWKHKYDRPWAYGDGPHLMGTWKGSFKDPDGITKQMELVITEPERRYLKKGRSKVRRVVHTNEFKGFATVTGKPGIERHRIEGDVETRDGHGLDRISFTPIDEKKQVLKSFNVFGAEKGGRWDGDSIRLLLSFTYRTETGSAYWSSADARFEKKARVLLIRTPQP